MRISDWSSDVCSSDLLVADAQAAPRRALAQLVKVGGGPVDAAARQRRDAGADEHEIRAELLHKIELVLGAVERAFALRLGQALEIAERLEPRDLQAVVARHAGDLLRRPVAGEEVGPEDLAAVQARRRAGGTLPVHKAPER